MTRRSLRDLNWYSLGWQSWLLGLEASSVIATRMVRLSAGGNGARIEFDRMINEKTEACLQLQAKLVALGPGATPAALADTALRHFRAKVTSNRRRLSR